MKNTWKILALATAALAVPAIASAADAADNWKTQCAKCHGPDGSASGPMGKRLKLKNYTDAAVQAAMTDEAMIAAITEGVKNDAGKDIMPAYAAKLTAEEIAALKDLVRSFKKE